jgi:hypothetical protein
VHPGCTGARETPKEQFKQEVEKELSGRETEPWGGYPDYGRMIDL